jgi:hypothetical protein
MRPSLVISEINRLLGLHSLTILETLQRGWLEKVLKACSEWLKPYYDIGLFWNRRLSGQTRDRVVGWFLVKN